MLGRYLLLAGTDIAVKLLGFTATVLIIRHLSPAEFGALSIATAVVLCAGVIGTFGLDLYSVRQVAKDPGSASWIVGTILPLRLLISASVYATLVGLAAVIHAFGEYWYLIAIVGLSLFTTALSVSWLAEGLQRARVLATANFATSFLNLAFVLAVLQWGVGLPGIAAAQVCAEAAVAAGLLIWATRSIALKRRPTLRGQWRPILTQSAPMGASRLMRAISLGSDLIVLGWFCSLQEVGWYGAANKLFLVGVSLIAVYFVAWFPRLVGLAKQSDDALRAGVRRNLNLLLAVVVPIAAISAWFSHVALNILFGPSFDASTGSLQILVVTLPVLSVAGLCRNALVAQGRQRREFAIVSIGAIFHLSSKLALIPMMGIAGAALGTLIGETALMVLGCWSVSKCFPNGTNAGKNDIEKGLS